MAQPDQDLRPSERMPTDGRRAVYRVLAKLYLDHSLPGVQVESFAKTYEDWTAIMGMSQQGLVLATPDGLSITESGKEVAEALLISRTQHLGQVPKTLQSEEERLAHEKSAIENEISQATLLVVSRNIFTPKADVEKLGGGEYQNWYSMWKTVEAGWVNSHSEGFTLTPAGKLRADRMFSSSREPGQMEVLAIYAANAVSLIVHNPGTEEMWINLYGRGAYELERLFRQYGSFAQDAFNNQFSELFIFKIQKLQTETEEKVYGRNIPEEGARQKLIGYEELSRRFKNHYPFPALVSHMSLITPREDCFAITLLRPRE